jgi:hypothetical protein
MLSSAKCKEEGLKLVQADIKRKTFKFPWSIWEIKHAFLSTFLAINEFMLASCLHPNNISNISEQEFIFVSKRSKRLEDLKNPNPKRKKKYIVNELANLKQSKDKYFWIGNLNKFLINNLYGKGSLNLKAIMNPIRKNEFEKMMTTSSCLNAIPKKFKLHLFCIIYNQYSDTLSKSNVIYKKSFLECNRFLNVIDKLFLTLNPKINKNYKEDLHDFLNRIYNSVHQKENSCYNLKILQSLKFISNFHCIMSGKKNRIILNETTNFIYRSCHKPEDILNLKILLSLLVNVE